MAAWTGCARACLSATVSAACSSLLAPPGPVHNSGQGSSLSPLVGLPCPLACPLHHYTALEWKDPSPLPTGLKALKPWLSTAHRSVYVSVYGSGCP